MCSIALLLWEYNFARQDKFDELRLLLIVSVAHSRPEKSNLDNVLRIIFPNVSFLESPIATLF